MDGFFARGGAVALLTIGVALPAVAQGGGSGASAGATRVRRDTVVRLDDATTRLQLDSIRVLMRAIDGEPAMSENGMKLRRELEAIMATIRMAPTRTRILFGSKSGGPATTFEFHTRGWIGITTGDAPMTHEISPSGYFVQYLAHPAIVSVDRDSPAQLAGIVAGDSLIAYDGVDVVGRTLNLNQMLMPDRKLGITVRRAGENKDYQVTVAKAPLTMFFRQPEELPPIDPRIDRVYAVPRGEVRVGGFGGRGTALMITSNGVFGARMTNLDAPAAKALGLQPGVLVQNVPEATAAARGGLLPGDIIVGVGGQPVTTLSDVQMASVRLSENRTVKLQIVREKKRRDVTLVWGAPTTPPSP